MICYSYHGKVHSLYFMLLLISFTLIIPFNILFISFNILPIVFNKLLIKYNIINAETIQFVKSQDNLLLNTISFKNYNGNLKSLKLNKG